MDIVFRPSGALNVGRKMSVFMCHSGAGVQAPWLLLLLELLLLYRLVLTRHPDFSTMLRTAHNTPCFLLQLCKDHS